MMAEKRKWGGKRWDKKRDKKEKEKRGGKGKRKQENPEYTVFNARTWEVAQHDCAVGWGAPLRCYRKSEGHIHPRPKILGP